VVYSIPSGTDPSASQRLAIEAPPGPLLVLAGPGAGKTFCLIERLRFLIERHEFDPARMLAFTFTNKAAGEIAHRLSHSVGAAVGRITKGTIHAFCARLLREFGSHVGIQPGFGIADENYQISVLRRVEGTRPRAQHRSALTRFSAHRFRDAPLRHDDVVLLDGYERFLAKRNVLDFDDLVLRTRDLLEIPDVAATVRARWDVILVDEFQDLNPVQYAIVRALAHDHRHVFAVGDDEQSIYSWAGADPKVFRTFMSDFGIGAPIHLDENRRCPRDVFALARKLVMVNKPLFAEREIQRADRESPFPVSTFGFASDEDEALWIVEDVRRDRDTNAHRWGDVALLYRKHEIGERLETAFLNAGIPCRLALGRALTDDPVIAYVMAAARAIAAPRDDVARDEFLRAVLPKTLCDEAAATPERARKGLSAQLKHFGAQLPRGDERMRQIRRAHANLWNLTALGRQHGALTSLLQDLLSRKVGKFSSALDDRHDQITDPAENAEVNALADRLREARARNKPVWVAPISGVEIGLKGMLEAIGLNVVRGPLPGPDVERVAADDVPSLGIALGIFKAAQLIEMSDLTPFTDFTAIDLETTDLDPATAEIVEVAAVRVRDGRVADTFVSLVKPGVPLAPDAAAAHGITEAELAGAPSFAEVWPKLREFCGDDVLVAHNGFSFDFRILTRMVRELGGTFDSPMYDSLPLARDLFPTSRQLPDLARQLGVQLEKAHRALADTQALAHVFLALDQKKLQRARKTALVNLLDHLGVALALCDHDQLCEEARVFRELTRVFALGPWSNCLECYERELGEDESLPTVEELIEKLGGMDMMIRLRRERTADQRYPVAMRRLRRLLAGIPDAPLAEQLSLFLERVALSKYEGDETAAERVNLLTLHSTKGLEFSRVYVVGAEDGQLPGMSARGTSEEEMEEARRLLYVGMTRTIDRLVLTRAASRGGKPTGAHRFLDEMELIPKAP
jgi:DNA polymerase III epsilon subunit family exonuclease